MDSEDQELLFDNKHKKKVEREVKERFSIKRVKCKVNISSIVQDGLWFSTMLMACKRLRKC